MRRLASPHPCCSSCSGWGGGCGAAGATEGRGNFMVECCSTMPLVAMGLSPSIYGFFCFIILLPVVVLKALPADPKECAPSQRLHTSLRYQKEANAAKHEFIFSLLLFILIKSLILYFPHWHCRELQDILNCELQQRDQGSSVVIPP